MRRMDAGRTYLVYSASSAVLFLLTFTIYSVFAITRLGLDPLQLVLLGSVIELTYLLAEVPTGVVADLVSRRLSVIIGLVGRGARVPGARALALVLGGRDLTGDLAESRRPSRQGPTWHGSPTSSARRTPDPTI